MKTSSNELFSGGLPSAPEGEFGMRTGPGGDGQKYEAIEKKKTQWGSFFWKEKRLNGNFVAPTESWGE